MNAKFCRTIFSARCKSNLRLLLSRTRRKKLVRVSLFHNSIRAVVFVVDAETDAKERERERERVRLHSSDTQEKELRARERASLDMKLALESNRICAPSDSKTSVLSVAGSRQIENSLAKQWSSAQCNGSNLVFRARTHRSTSYFREF